MHITSCVPLHHLDRMTDSTGLIQHAIYNIPRRETGYTTDDNARALRLCARLYCKQSDQHMLERVSCYLSFMEHARCTNGGFHNYMSYQRVWLDEIGCGDSQGQAVLALAEVIASELPHDFRTLSRELIDRAIPLLANLTSLRAHAYVVQAWAMLWRAKITNFNALETVARHSVGRLVDAWNHWVSSDWQWFEPQMTYANAVLPHALFDAGECWSNEEYLSIAAKSFAFLDATTTTDNIFWPIGNNGWNSQDTEKSHYDQQPVEASTMAAAAMTALKLMNDPTYLVAFQKARGWFHGHNSLRCQMADIESGGCLDGLLSIGVNRNQGAESMLAYLWTEALASELPRNSKMMHGGASRSGLLMQGRKESVVH